MDETLKKAGTAFSKASDWAQVRTDLLTLCRALSAALQRCAYKLRTRQ